MPIRAGGLNAACQPVAPSDGVDLECGVRNWESGTLVCSYFTSHIPNSAFRIPRSKFPIPTKSSRVDSNHRFTACKAAAFAARPRDVCIFNSELQPPISDLVKKYPTEESNLVQLFRRQSCVHHTRKAKVVSLFKIRKRDSNSHNLLQRQVTRPRDS